LVEETRINKNFDIYYSGYIQTHCQKNKKIKLGDQILPEVYGNTLNEIINKHFFLKRCIRDIRVI
jgi:hypothetical protein